MEKTAYFLSIGMLFLKLIQISLRQHLEIDQKSSFSARPGEIIGLALITWRFY